MGSWLGQLTKRRGLGSICRASRLSSRPSRCCAKCTQWGRVRHWGGGSTPLSPCSTRVGAQQRVCWFAYILVRAQKQGQPVATWILACKDRRAHVDHLGLGAVTPATRPCAMSQDPEVLSPVPWGPSAYLQRPAPSSGDRRHPSLVARPLVQRGLGGQPFSQTRACFSQRRLPWNG